MWQNIWKQICLYLPRIFKLVGQQYQGPLSIFRVFFEKGDEFLSQANTSREENFENTRHQDWGERPFTHRVAHIMVRQLRQGCSVISFEKGLQIEFHEVKC